MTLKDRVLGIPVRAIHDQVHVCNLAMNTHNSLSSTVSSSSVSCQAKCTIADGCTTLEMCGQMCGGVNTIHTSLLEPYSSQHCLIT